MHTGRAHVVPGAGVVWEEGNSVTLTHAALLDASVAISKIAGCASWYTADLAERIAGTGKNVADLTISELIALDIALRAEIARQRLT